MHTFTHAFHRLLAFHIFLNREICFFPIILNGLASAAMTALTSLVIVGTLGSLAAKILPQDAFHILPAARSLCPSNGALLPPTGYGDI